MILSQQEVKTEFPVAFEAVGKYLCKWYDIDLSSNGEYSGASFSKKDGELHLASPKYSWFWCAVMHEGKEHWIWLSTTQRYVRLLDVDSPPESFIYIKENFLGVR